MKKRWLFLGLYFCLALVAGCTGSSGSTPPTELPSDSNTESPALIEDEAPWFLTCRIVDGTGITVTRLVTESVSCLHDYSLNVRQEKAAEAAETIVISGAGLEEFLEDALSGAEEIIDASDGLTLLEGEHIHDHGHDHGHPRRHRGRGHDRPGSSWTFCRPLPRRPRSHGAPLRW